MQSGGVNEFFRKVQEGRPYLDSYWSFLSVDERFEEFEANHLVSEGEVTIP